MSGFYDWQAEGWDAEAGEEYERWLDEQETDDEANQ